MFNRYFMLGCIDRTKLFVSADTLNKEQERLKSELKSKTEELNEVRTKIEKNYSLVKKSVKLAEPQTPNQLGGLRHY